MYQYETKKELREALRGRTIREVHVGGTMTDAREFHLDLTDGSTVTVAATGFGTLKIGSDAVRRDQSKHVGADGTLRYTADGSEVFPGPTGVRR